MAFPSTSQESALDNSSAHDITDWFVCNKILQRAISAIGPENLSNSSLVLEILGCTLIYRDLLNQPTISIKHIQSCLAHYSITGIRYQLEKMLAAGILVKGNLSNHKNSFGLSQEFHNILTEAIYNISVEARFAMKVHRLDGHEVGIKNLLWPIASDQRKFQLNN